MLRENRSSVANFSMASTVAAGASGTTRLNRSWQLVLRADAASLGEPATRRTVTIYYNRLLEVMLVTLNSRCQ